MRFATATFAAALVAGVSATMSAEPLELFPAESQHQGHAEEPPVLHATEGETPQEPQAITNYPPEVKPGLELYPKEAVHEEEQPTLEVYPKEAVHEEEQPTLEVYPKEPVPEEEEHVTPTPVMTTKMVTEVVTEFTTFCPTPTEVVYDEVTYTVTEATTLTITNCPCTVTVPVTVSVVTECHDCPAPTEAPSPPPVSLPSPIPPPVSLPSPIPPPVSIPSPIAPVVPVLPSPVPFQNATTTKVTSVRPTGAPVGTGVVTPMPPPFEGAAPRMFIASGAALGAVLAFAAYVF